MDNKTNKMKKPKFLKYNDEKDEYIDKRNKWIIDMDVNNVKKYLMKKYNISI